VEEEESGVYSSAVVHNNRSSRVLCVVCRQRSREGERDMEGFAWVRWALGRPLALTAVHVIQTALLPKAVV
jgi:hypothetical protein